MMMRKIDSKGRLASIPRRKWQWRFYLDHFRLLQETQERYKLRYKYILLVIDAFTRFTWLCLVKATSTREVIEHLSSIFATFQQV